ncbi:MAG: ABC transporter permease, partial [Defluviitaleaceae bacterium]|nr:ABC transporter permease [Defluviitaleaceae bacterium]
SLLDMQVSGIQSVATSLPFVFVAMSVVVLYLMMKRIIEQERTQIGTLKAFGYSNQDLILHYLCYGGITGLIGGLIGFAYGAPMSALYLSIFLEFFILPDLVQPVDFSYFIFAMAVSLGGGMLGAFMGALKILELNPAEAMKPEAPKPVKNDIIGKIKVLRLILTSRGQMSLRGIIRHPVRSGFVILGVTFSFGLLVVFGSMANIMDAMIYAQFRDIRVYDMRVTLTQPMAYNTAVEAAHGIPHITRAEGILELPATLRSRHLQTGTLVTGISGDGQLFRVFDTTSRTAYPPPRDSLIITNGLADALNVSTGDVIYIGSPLMRDDVPIPVSQIIEQSVGSGAFMEIGAMSALFDQPMTASSIIFTTNDLPFVRDYFRESQNTANIEDVGGTLQKYMDMMDPFMSIFGLLNIMGTAVAFAIIYNTATISLSERKREYATLRVLGMTIDEVCEIMGFEYWVLSVAGMLLGIPFASMLIVGVNGMMDTNMFSMPSALPFSAYITGAVGCSVAIILSNWSAKRKISKFDMVEVLKERE